MANNACSLACLRNPPTGEAEVALRLTANLLAHPMRVCSARTSGVDAAPCHASIGSSVALAAVRNKIPRGTASQKNLFGHRYIRTAAILKF